MIGDLEGRRPPPSPFAGLANQISELKAELPLARITVIAPQMTWGSGIREGLAAEFPDTGFANVEVLSLRVLADTLATPHLPLEMTELDEPTLVAAVREVMAEAPGFFGPVADHPSTIDELASRVALLSRLTHELRQALAVTGDRAADVEAVSVAALSPLADRCLDEGRLFELATHVVAGAPESELERIVGVGMVVLDTRPLSPRSQRLLDALSARLSVRHIAWASPEPGSDFVVSAREVEAVTTTDAEEEVRVAVRTVVSALASAPRARCVILRPSRQPYTRMLREHLVAAGIASYDPEGMLVTESLAYRLLSHLAELDPGSLALPEVVRLLRAVPLRAPDGGSIPTAKWRSLAAEVGVHGSDADWSEQALERANAKESEARDSETPQEDEDVETFDWQVDRLRRDSAQLRRLAAFVEALGSLLRAGREVSDWSALATWADGAITSLLDLGHGGEAAQPQRAATLVVRDVIQRLGKTASIEANPETLVVELKLLLDGASRSVGSPTTGVTVVGPARAASLAPDVLVVLGLSEGVLPGTTVEDPWWTDEAIEQLRQHPDEAVRCEAAAELRTGRDRIVATEGWLRAAVASTRARLVLSRPKGDLRGTVERSASRWWQPLMDAARAAGVEPVPLVVQSQGEGLREAAHPASASEARARALLRASDDRPTPDTLAAVGGAGGLLTANRDLRIARARPDYTSFDGRLAAVVDDPSRVSLANPSVEVSASRIATYLSCPWKYAMTYELGVSEPDDDELAFQQGISPAALGSLVHEVLEQYVGEQIATGSDTSQGWDVPDLDRLLDILEREFAALGPEIVGRDAVEDESRQRAEGLVLKWPDQDSAWRSGIGALAAAGATARPVLLERRFGVRWSDAGPEDVPVRIDLGDGRGVGFRGKIDRLDVLSDGRFGVLDYKTGKPKTLTQVQEPQNLFQISVYVAAARALVDAGHVPGVTNAEDPVVGYWYVASEGESALQTLTYTDAHHDEFIRILREVVDLVDAGAFPPGHTKAGFSGWACPFCSAFGFAHARRIHRVKGDDELLARALAFLADPKGFVVEVGEVS